MSPSNISLIFTFLGVTSLCVAIVRVLFCRPTKKIVPFMVILSAFFIFAASLIAQREDRKTRDTRRNENLAVKVFEVPRLEVRSLGPQTGVIVSTHSAATLMGAGVLLVTVRLDPPILGLPDVVGAITSTSGPRREGEKVTIVFKSYGLANEAVSNDTSPPDGGWYVQ
ncbi:MAG: hypothetical protein LiPW15_126 [Parcubacteria group bacterium LiPW_15]|nr:MAG: hypothetical protein LiPW15_126 [Parcubacteria group bacterium LiPW_15]